MGATKAWQALQSLTNPNIIVQRGKTWRIYGLVKRDNILFSCLFAIYVTYVPWLGLANFGRCCSQIFALRVESKPFFDPTQPNMAHSVYVSFVAMSGASCIIQVAPGDSVMNAKTNAASKLGLTASCTRVMLHGKWLNDDDDFYNMEPDQFNCVHILKVEPDTTETNSTDKHTDSTTETASTDKHTDSTTDVSTSDP